VRALSGPVCCRPGGLRNNVAVSAAPSPSFDTVVMKFGGSSVADPEKIKRVARRLVEAKERGLRVVGTVSAMGKTTDGLLELARQVSPMPPPRELDMLLSVGERVSCALVAMAINDLGHQAVSLTGSQAGIETDAAHTKAKITHIRADRVRGALDAGRIVLVAGFQGVSRETLDVTTLGRGGTDATPSRWRRRSAPPARSTRTWPGCSPPTRASSPAPASCRSSPTRRCSRCPPRGPRC
jgi:hypothetical protein